MRHERVTGIANDDRVSIKREVLTMIDDVCCVFDGKEFDKGKASRSIRDVIARQEAALDCGKLTKEVSKAFLIGDLAIQIAHA